MWHWNTVPVAVQGVYSYTCWVEVCMPHESARSIYGRFAAPCVTFMVQVGRPIESKKPLNIYVISRVRYIGYLGFILAHNTDFRVPFRSLSIETATRITNKSDLMAPQRY